MLPLPLQFIIVMMAHAIDERMARKLDYLLEEVRVTCWGSAGAWPDGDLPEASADHGWVDCGR